MKLALATLTLALATPLAAQVLRGGDVIVADYAVPGIFRVDARGSVTTLAGPRQVAGPSGIAADFDGSMVVCDFSANQLIRVDRAGNLSTIASNLSGPLRVAVDRDGSYLVTMVNSRGIDRVFASGAVANFLAAGSGGMRRAFSITTAGDGDYVVCDDSGAGLYKVSQRGVVTPIHIGSPLRLPQGAALFPNGDYAVMDGLTDSVFRVDRATGMVSTWVSTAALGGNPDGIVAAGDGGFLVSQSSSSLNQVVRIDAAGVVTPLASGLPFRNLEVCAMVPFLTGPTSMTTGPGSVASLGIDLPTLPNTTYALGLSASLFPGLTLPGESRALIVNPDGLFLSTFGINIPPVLTNWTAVTDAAGRATPGLDLSILPPGLLAGRTLFVQGVALRSGAPNAIDTITNYQPLSFH